MPMFQVHDVKEFSFAKFVIKVPVRTPQVQCRVYCLEPGQVLPVHQHQQATDVFHVIEGVGELTLGNDLRLVHPGAVILIPPAEDHGMANPGPKQLVFTSVYIPKH
ncbi:MAG: cupin domain-containing protein [Chloroflexota bacterium]